MTPDNNVFNTIVAILNESAEMKVTDETPLEEAPASNPAGAAKSKAAAEYLRLQFAVDQMTNDPDIASADTASLRKLGAMTKQRDAALQKVQSLFGANANAVKSMLDKMANKFYLNQPVKETAAAPKLRATAGMDEAVWQKLMASEWDQDFYQPFEDKATQAGKLAPDERSQLYGGLVFLKRSLPKIAAKLANNAALRQEVEQEFGKELEDVKKLLNAAFPFKFRMESVMTTEAATESSESIQDEIYPPDIVSRDEPHVS